MFTTTEKLRQSAYAHYERGAVWDAASDCLRAITCAPGTAWPYVLLGKCYMRTGRKRDAIAMLERSLQLLPPYSEDSAAIVRELIAEAEK